MSFAFRSCILVSAICCSWARVMVPTFTRCDSGEPLGSLMASLMSTAAGGVLVMNENERSS